MPEMKHIIFTLVCEDLGNLELENNINMKTMSKKHEESAKVNNLGSQIEHLDSYSVLL